MPELPEVHTIVTDLNSSISCYKIIGVDISKGYTTLPSNVIFQKTVIGQNIEGVERKAKNILIKLSSGNYILIHLAMTGRVLLRRLDEDKDNWQKVCLKIKKGKDLKEIRFTDTRMFGKVMVVGEKGIRNLDQKYGPEILDGNLTAETFYEIVKSKKTNIKNVLLDQAAVSGLGNIYATDALFMAGISPNTHTSQITPEGAKKLLASAKKILLEGISNRGSTLPDKSYVDIFGKEGKQQNFFKIYMKDVCPNCKSKVIFIKLNGRGTYYCENCQPQNNQNSLFK